MERRHAAAFRKVKTAQITGAAQFVHQRASSRRLPLFKSGWFAAAFGALTAASALWLRFLPYDPLEWLWRSLVYWKRQPMVR
ncbi:MAG: DUF418 domain-containing protein [Caulobacter sp.]|nr:DUF418 domain-containing protein [Caulobacter sp.]